MASLRKVKQGWDIDKTVLLFTKEKSVLPKLIANKAVNHFKSGFREGGGKTNASKSGWQERQFKDEGRATLVKSRILKKDIKVLMATFRKTKVGTGVTTKGYAQIHNEGGVISVTEKQRRYFAFKAAKAKNKADRMRWGRMIGASQIRIPKREYIGRSFELNKKIGLLMLRRINETFV